MSSLESINPGLLSEQQVLNLIDLLKEKKQLAKEKKQLSFSCTIDIKLDSSINSILNKCSNIFSDKHIGTENLCFRLETASYCKEKKSKKVLWSELLETLKVLKFNHPKIDIVISGFQFLWQVAQENGEELESLFSELRNYGVQVIESSSEEFEGTLTNSEILHFHKQSHLCNLPSIAKIELNQSYEDKTLLWRKMIKKLEGYIELQKKTKGLLGVILETAPNTFISNQQYLNACLITKFISQKSSFRLISSSRKISSSLLCQHGIDDLGHFCLLQHQKPFFDDLIKEASNYDFDLYTRDALFTKSFFTSLEAPFLNKFLDGKNELSLLP